MVGTVTDSLHTMHSEIEEYEKIELESSLEEYKRLLTEAKQAILSRSIVSYRAYQAKFVPKPTSGSIFFF